MQKNFTLKRIVCLLAALCLAAGLVGCADMPASSSEESSLPTILVGSDVYPPFNYMGTDGAPTGIDVELATEAFGRLGYRVKFVTIDWEKKKELVENDTIDCIWGSFSMDGREEEYQWAGPYLYSRQVVAVRSDSDIRTLQDLAGKVVAVQSTTKPEELFLNAEQNGLPRLRRLYSLQNRDLLYTTLLKGYADALAAHESAIRQFMKDYSVEYRILDEPLLITGIGAAFSVDDDRGLAQELMDTFAQMRQDGTMQEIVGRYLEHPETYLEVECLEP